MSERERESEILSIYTMRCSEKGSSLKRLLPQPLGTNVIQITVIDTFVINLNAALNHHLGYLFVSLFQILN